MSRIVLTAESLSIGYRRGASLRPIAQQLNLTLRQGELVALLGPNGAGKSTLLRTLAGLHSPLAGRVLLGERDLSRLSLPERARLLGVVLTDRVDSGAFQAREVVALGRYPYTGWAARLSPEDHEVVEWALRAVDGAALADRPLSHLSDGERQKIMIARALAQQPQVIILDEPTAYLDLPRRVEIMHLLRSLARTTDCAILLSTHDVELALRISDQMWLLADGKMRIGAPEDLVLDGGFARAFISGMHGTVFEPETGTFAMQRTPAASPIQITGGTEIETIWTRRAAERAGMQVDPSAADRIEIHDRGWRLIRAGQIAGECATLYELVERLKQG